MLCIILFFADFSFFLYALFGKNCILCRKIYLINVSFQYHASLNSTISASLSESNKGAHYNRGASDARPTHQGHPSRSFDNRGHYQGNRGGHRGGSRGGHRGGNRGGFRGNRGSGRGNPGRGGYQSWSNEKNQRFNKRPRNEEHQNGGHKRVRMDNDK